MITIFRYECRRLTGNRFFFGMAAILLFFGQQTFERVTLTGVSHTAPFSPWSLGDFACRMLPLLWAAALFFLTFFTSPQARRTAVLTACCPVSPRRYAAVRLAAALAGTGILTILCLAEAAALTAWYFQLFIWDIVWKNLLFPALITLVPPLIFALGSGWRLGNLCPRLLFGWMALPFFLRLLPLADNFRLWNGQFFAQYPLTAGVLDPAFSIPAPMVLLQLLLAAGGIILAGLFPLPALPMRTRRQTALRSGEK